MSGVIGEGGGDVVFGLGMKVICPSVMPNGKGVFDELWLDAVRARG